MTNKIGEKRLVLIVTCRAGSEDWCEEEIGNVLFHKDYEIEVLKTRYPGLLMVYSSRLKPDEAYRYARSYEYGFVEKIIPANEIIIYSDSITPDRLEKAVDSLIQEKNLPSRVRLKMKIRGYRGLSPILWKNIIRILDKHGLRHDPSSQICLYVEGIDDLLVLGIAEC